MSAEESLPRLRVRGSTIGANPKPPEESEGSRKEAHKQRHRTGSSLKRLHWSSSRAKNSHGPTVYEGSYRSSITPADIARGFLHPPGISTPRTSVSHLQLEPLLEGIGQNVESYGLHEFRDGLFDATFVRPVEPADTESAEDSSNNRLVSMPPEQLRRLQQIIVEVFTTRAGVRLFKSFLGFFVCYILCLIPATAHWLGTYNYIIAVSAILNHPGRSIGSQLDGALFTCLGSMIGLLWGAFAVWLSSSTQASQQGFGAVVAPLFVIFTMTTGYLRCLFGRLYQAVVAAGIAFFYITLSEDYGNPGAIGSVLASRIAAFLIPWSLGQGICLSICVLIFPSAGNRPFGLALHLALGVVRQSFTLPRPHSHSLNRMLAFHFVNVSQAARDFALDLTFSRFADEDCIMFRNRLQGVIRAALAFRPSSGHLQAATEYKNSQDGNEEKLPLGSAPEIEGPGACVNRVLGPPTWRLLELCQTAIDMVDYIVMSVAGYSKSFNIKSFEPEEIQRAVTALAEAQKSFDAAEKALTKERALRSVAARHEEVVSLFVFMHPIRQAAEKVYDLLAYASMFHETNPHWRLRLPSYPWSKAFFRMNSNVRHDRGGLTAGHYFGSKRQLEKTLRDLQNRSWMPLNRYVSREEWEHHDAKVPEETTDTTKHQQSGIKLLFRRFLHSVWIVLHRLQDFEARFALKVTIVCVLLSLPAFLPQSSPWWYSHDSWWVTVTIWIMMHPRVGGNLSDLLIRCFCAAIGAIWAGLSYAAGRGNPVVLGAFGLIFEVLMLYRFTQSNHPRSGVVGCLSFAVISLIINNQKGQPGIIYLTWTRGMAFLVGVVVGVVVNWIFWPFVARHELRKSIAAMILHSSFVYRRILATYIYYDEGEEPKPDDISTSEMLEGRIREGFVRVRQLMALTKHEIQLRGPFDPKPYAALIDSCEVFFDRLIDVRQATLFFKPELQKRTDNKAHNLFVLRRDAVASMLMILYVLAGALRECRPLPRYLPSPALSRQQLLDTMDVVEEEAQTDSQEHGEERSDGQTWADVYHYAFSGALTDCVEQVQLLVQLTRCLTGEVPLPNVEE